MTLIDKIESIRNELNRLVSNSSTLSQDEIIKVSQELDSLLEAYHKSIYRQ